MSNFAYLLIGSNINKLYNIQAAYHYLKQYSLLLNTSSIYETLARGINNEHLDQETYYNFACLLETTLSADEIKTTICRPIEQRLLRIRKQDRFIARTIDIDIVLFNQDIITTQTLQLPAPDILKYAHICIPLAEIAPDYIHPLEQKSLLTIAQDFLPCKEVKKLENTFFE